MHIFANVRKIQGFKVKVFALPRLPIHVAAKPVIQHKLPVTQHTSVFMVGNI